MGNRQVHDKHLVLAVMLEIPTALAATNLTDAGRRASAVRSQLEREPDREVGCSPRVSSETHEALAWSEGLRAGRPEISQTDAMICACLSGPTDAIELWFRQAGGDPDLARSLVGGRLALPSMTEQVRPRWSEWRAISRQEFEELRRHLQERGVRYRFGHQDDRVMISFDERVDTSGGPDLTG